MRIQSKKTKYRLPLTSLIFSVQGVPMEFQDTAEKSNVLPFNFASTMFFLKQLSHTIQLLPQYFNRDLEQNLKRRLYDETEGSCSGRYGYIIAVVKIIDIGKGVLQSSSGIAEFTIKYEAVVFKPFRNQVVDGIVTTVNKLGFFADVGPMQCFVSVHSIPSYLKFDPSSNPPAIVGSTEKGTQDIRIQKGEPVRIRIIGLKLDQSEIVSFSKSDNKILRFINVQTLKAATGSIKEHFLGLSPDE
ncbi:DNA-directed RNA polymerase II subunit [Nowakowskiella sp. JEL0078]|nr:DNA-directed RNA polymerase II subunit [Nowakowskiella sp. JEL0078]